MSRFGDALRKLRIEKGMSQEEFAALLGTSKQVISRYEIGQRSPKISIVADYAERLDVPISYFVSQAEISYSLGSESPSAKKLYAIGSELSDSLSHCESELLSIFRSLNDLGQQTLLGTARGLAANPDMKKDGELNTGTA